MKYLKVEIHEFASGVAWEFLESNLPNSICLGGSFMSPSLQGIHVSSDLSAQNIIDAIQAEFTRKGELKDGERCEVSHNKVDWTKRELLAILPEDQAEPYICVNIDYLDKHNSWAYARPIDRKIEPTIDGDIYEWKNED